MQNKQAQSLSKLNLPNAYIQSWVKNAFQLRIEMKQFWGHCQALSSMLATDTVEPPGATTLRWQPPFQNTKNVLSQSLILEPPVSVCDHCFGWQF